MNVFLEGIGHDELKGVRTEVCRNGLQEPPDGLTVWVRDPFRAFHSDNRFLKGLDRRDGLAADKTIGGEGLAYGDPIQVHIQQRLDRLDVVAVVLATVPNRA